MVLYCVYREKRDEALNFNYEEAVKSDVANVKCLRIILSLLIRSLSKCAFSEGERSE